MINWDKEEPIHIENVNHEVIILGVKPAVLPCLGFVAIGSMLINPLLTFVGPTLIIFLSRRYYRGEETGFPEDYEPRFQKVLNVFRPLKIFFPSVPYIRHREESYR